MKGTQLKKLRKGPRIAAAATLAACMVTMFAVLGGVGSAQSSVSAGQYQHGAKVTICHKGKHTITVGKAAVPAHLRHGDTIGSCTSAAAKAKKAKKAKAAAAHAKADAAKSKAAEKSQAPAEGDKPGKGKGRGK
jgi:microcystin-dependent protein